MYLTVVNLQSIYRKLGSIYELNQFNLRLAGASSIKLPLPVRELCHQSRLPNLVHVMLGCQLRFITVVYHATMYTGIPFLLINFKYTSLGTFFEIDVENNGDQYDTISCRLRRVYIQQEPNRGKTTECSLSVRLLVRQSHN
jgi:hypothetical protein